MVATAKRGGVLFHHPSQGGDTGRQAEMREADPNRLSSFRVHYLGVRLRRSGISRHGVALHRGLNAPSLRAQVGHRRRSYFNVGRSIH